MHVEHTHNERIGQRNEAFSGWWWETRDDVSAYACPSDEEVSTGVKELMEE
jgi:hypothetical protein